MQPVSRIAVVSAGTYRLLDLLVSDCRPPSRNQGALRDLTGIVDVAYFENRFVSGYPKHPAQNSTYLEAQA